MNETDNLFDTMGGSGDPGNEAPETTTSEGSSGADITGRDGLRAEVQPKAAAWMSQLPKELREGEVYNKISGFKTLGELVSAFANQGKAEVHDEDDDTALLNRLGVPKPDEEYGIEGLIEKAFIDSARNLNLSKGQAAGMADYVNSIKAQFNSGLEKYFNDNVKHTASNWKNIQDGLKKEFGSEAALFFNKAAVQAGIVNELKRSSLGGNPQIARALCLLGRAMTEDSTGEGSTTSRKTNTKPWAEGGGFSYSK